MKRKSFWKSQWLNLLFGIFATVIAIICGFIGYELMMIAWCLSAVTWFIMANVNYHEERILYLEKEVEELKKRAITDIEKISPNHFIVRRKLGPDKEHINS